MPASANFDTLGFFLTSCFSFLQVISCNLRNQDNLQSSKLNVMKEFKFYDTFSKHAFHFPFSFVLGTLCSVSSHLFLQTWQWERKESAHLQ